MKSLLRAMTAAVLAAALVLPGCGGQQEPQRSPEKKEQKSEKKNGEKKGGDKKKQDPIVSGANKMQTKLDELSAALKAGDQNEVLKESRELDDSWESFEQKVEAKNPDLHAQVEDSLNRVLAGAQLVPFDNNVIQNEIKVLDQKLSTLKETKGAKDEPKKVDKKTGAAAMRQHLTELKQATEKGDTAKMQEKAKAAEKAWTQFETEVRESSQKDYEAVEDSLHTTLAEVKASPPDKEKLKSEIEKLDKKLTELSK